MAINGKPGEEKHKPGGNEVLLDEPFGLMQLKDKFVLEEKEGVLILYKKRPDLRNVYLEVTSNCNLECVTCIRRQWKDHQGNDMEFELFLELLRQLEDFPHLDRVHLGGFGEPLAHPFIIDIVARLKERGLRVSMSTNGTLLTSEISRELVKAGIDKIFFSMDSVEEKTFRGIRVKGELDNLINNLTSLRKIKVELNRYNPKIGVEFVMMRRNIKDVHRLPGMSKELGVYSVLLTNILAHSPEMYREVLYEKPGGRKITENKILGPPPWDREALNNFFPPQNMWPVYEGGWVLWGTMSVPRMYWGAGRKCTFIENNSTIIRVDGKVSPCYALMYSYPYYFDNRSKIVSSYLVGDIKEETLLEIWNGPEYIKFRHTVRCYNFPSCVDCQVKKDCEYALNNEDCWGNNPSCADCLWSQGIIRCP